MRRQLLRGSVFTVIIALLTAFILVFTLFDGMYVSMAKSEITNVLSLLSASYREGEDPSAYLRDSHKALTGNTPGSYRLTIIDAATGTVLAETEPGAAAMDHSTRPEVQSAIQSGMGESTRRSDTTGMEYLYIALKADGLIFRGAKPLYEVYAIRTTLMLMCIVGLMAGIVAALLRSRHWANKVVKPVEELTRAAAELKEGGGFARVSPGPDEIGVLGEAFNDMAAAQATAMYRLKEKQTQLSGVLYSILDGVIAVDERGRVLFFNDHALDLPGFEGILLNVPLHGTAPLNELHNLLMDTIRKGEAAKTTLSLKGGEVEAEVHTTCLNIEEKPMGAVAVVRDVTTLRKLEQMRKEFVSNVTHELKTPLTSIRGYVELLKTGERDAPTRQSFYDIIDIESERLHALIEDLLQLSEIENGRDDPRTMVAPLTQALMDMERRFRHRGESIEFTIQREDGILLQMNPVRLLQLLTNLIDNAFKYNTPNGSVAIRAKKDGEHCILTVADTGIGIPKAEQERIFERFYRVDKGRSRAMGGTGLGLAIVKHIVLSVGGTIEVASVPGEGTTFTLTLPLFEGNL
ncbi:MAG: cell wall metabolism sensor histidine kinase WalK [Clostridiales bacterium]|nr:cell wall metabolism sensor histidine kinase WalK [Clostridiales bacterium]